MSANLKIAHEHPGNDIGEQLLKPLEKPEIREFAGARRISLRRLRRGRAAGVRHRVHRQQGFSERITTAPVSPLGQQFYVKTAYAMAVAAPTTLAPDPTRMQHAENHEQAVPCALRLHLRRRPVRRLILVGAATLLDGNPTNNFLKREVTFNPDGMLNGARAITIVGNYAYICCDAGLVVVDLDDPKHPCVTVGGATKFLHHPMAVQVQFRYAFVGDHEGLKVLDVTDLANPVAGGVSSILDDVHNLYLARTYAYVAAGNQGLVIVDIENPERAVRRSDLQRRRLHQRPARREARHHLHQRVRLSGRRQERPARRAAHVARHAGQRGFSPRPTPYLIATRKLAERAKHSRFPKGLDRDRAVDESGNQIAVFGRVGARPLNLDEQQKMYLRDGEVWRVSDDPQFYKQTPVKGFGAPDFER